MDKARAADIPTAAFDRARSNRYGIVRAGRFGHLELTGTATHGPAYRSAEVRLHRPDTVAAVGVPTSETGIAPFVSVSVHRRGEVLTRLQTFLSLEQAQDLHDALGRALAEAEGATERVA